MIPGRRPAVAAGWLLLAISTVFWGLAAGAEFGIPYALLFVPLLAWIAVLINLEVRFKKHKEQAAGTIVWPRGHTITQNLLLFLMSVPLAAVAATLVSVTLVRLLPWQELNQFVLAAFLMPVLWGCAAYWVCADSRMLRPALALAAAGGVSALILYV